MTSTLPGSALQGLRSGWPDDTAPFDLAAPVVPARGAPAGSASGAPLTMRDAALFLLGGVPLPGAATAPTAGWSVARPQGPDPTQAADALEPRRAAVRALADLSNRWLQASSAAGQPLNDPRARPALAKLFGGSLASPSRPAPPAADGAAGAPAPTGDDAAVAGDAAQGAVDAADGSFELAAARKQDTPKPSQARQVPPTRLTQSQMDDLETNLKNPNVQAFLSTIANTEGATYNSLRNARDGSKRTFDDYARYPGETSGRYQIIPTTYAGLRAKLGRDDYSPHTQDLMAIQRIIDRGAMPSLLSGDLDAVLPKVAPEWASLEKGRGAGNAYKAQHYVPYDRIRAIFDLNRSP